MSVTLEHVTRSVDGIPAIRDMAEMGKGQPITPFDDSGHGRD